MSTQDEIAKDLAFLATQAIEEYNEEYSKNEDRFEALKAIAKQRISNNLERVTNRAIDALLMEKMEAHAEKIVDMAFSSWIKKGEIHISEVPAKTRAMLKAEFDRLTDLNLNSAPSRMLIAVHTSIRKGQDLRDIANALDIPLKEVKSLALKAEKSAARVKREYELYFGEDGTDAE